ncbi:MAG: hypothetical protein RR232_03445 [Clostridia bacterium]
MINAAPVFITLIYGENTMAIAIFSQGCAGKSTIAAADAALNAAKIQIKCIIPAAPQAYHHR